MQLLLTRPTVCIFTCLLLICTTLQAQPDNDRDGISDALEHQLLERFRPFFMFSDDGGEDNFRPTDAWWYIGQSEMLLSGDESKEGCLSNAALATSPNALLFAKGTGCAVFGASTISQNPDQTGYHLNPMNKVRGQGDDPGRHGSEWRTVLASKRIGLYGHVVPIKLTDPYGYRFGATYDGNSKGATYYKIEYWQFFGYNSANKPFNIGDHEGDWTSVQLIYDLQANIIRSIFHFAHGILFRYDITPENNARTVTFNIPEGTIKEYRGLNYNFQDQSLELSRLDLGTVPQRILWNDSEIARAQNNTVRFFQDRLTQDFSHPVVYIEHGTHEFFPSENWSYYGVPNHNGRSYHYLTSTPPNLGEVEFPLGEDHAAVLIMRFNGFWGSYGNRNDPPQGPILHQNWQWSMGSSIRWQIHKSMGF